MIEAPDLPRPRPRRAALDGRYVRLEPIDALRHAAALYETTGGEGAAARYRYMSEDAPVDVAACAQWCARAAERDDPLVFAVVDRADGAARGRQALMRIVPEHGVIEIGSIVWGRGLARTRLATEALYLCARHVFDELGYRRFEWKCNALNEPSRRAAERFGFRFEGIFRQHMWLRGANRDTAWYAMLDGEWRGGLRSAYESWLDPANFDMCGAQRRRLTEVLAMI